MFEDKGVRALSGAENAMEQMKGAPGAVVLVVDDDSALAESLQFAMELEGFKVQTFADAESLLSARAYPKRGCLVIDVKLPGIDGLELLKQLRARGVTLPAVLITTNPTSSLRVHAAAAAAPIVEKPLLQDELIDTVRSLTAA
jgi:two-component system, LuxR family, response regulator FixJ